VFIRRPIPKWPGFGITAYFTDVVRIVGGKIAEMQAFRQSGHINRKSQSSLIPGVSLSPVMPLISVANWHSFLSRLRWPNQAGVLLGRFGLVAQ
jgi:hypothetical protein